MKLWVKFGIIQFYQLIGALSGQGREMKVSGARTRPRVCPNKHC